MVTRLRYGNTNTFLVRGSCGTLLVDTDMAGTLPQFYKALKACGIRVAEIDYVMATHYHPDHMGLVSELMEQGVQLLLIDMQKPYVHFSDGIFARDAHLRYRPIRENDAVVITCGDSRAFLRELGIDGEIRATPGHSEDSISLFLDEGICIAGDLEPLAYLAGYESEGQSAADWELILEYEPKIVYHAHAPATTF